MLKNIYNNQDSLYEKPKHLTLIILPVLKMFWGSKFDKTTNNFLNSLRPSIVRIIKPRKPYAIDNKPWRVSVFVDKNNIIEKIEQEVMIGLEK
jgi:hypothetical protein